MRVFWPRILLVGLLLLAWPAVTFCQDIGPADFVVSPRGSDHNPGSIERPFATVFRAQNAVRELTRAGHSSDITVLLRGGHYSLTAPLVFGPDDSAPEGHSIVYAGWPGETPVLSGGHALTGWHESGENQWTMQIPQVVSDNWSFDQLFIDGRRKSRARHPNQGFLRVAAAGRDDRTNFRFRKNDLPSAAFLAGAELVFLHDWSISRVTMQQVDHRDGRIELAQPIGAASMDLFRITGFEPHPRYFLENSLDLLDAPGEWYLDQRKGQLTYRSVANDALSQATTVAPWLERLLVVRGDPERGRPVRNLHFVGLTFAYAAAPRFPAGYAGIQAGFHEQRPGASSISDQARMPAAIVFESAHGCSLESCRVVHVGGTAISLQGGCRDNQISANEIADVGGNGVMVGQTDAHPPDLDVHNAIVNNHIHQCGIIFFGCVGVWVGIAEGTTVSHNEIHDLPYTGISVGWVWDATSSLCREHRIEQNHIHHVMQLLSDGGGVYTLGRQPGTVLRGNVVHDIPANAGFAQSNGCFMDEGSSELLVENNIIYNVARSPIRFHLAQSDIVRDNVLVTPVDTPPFQFDDTDKNSIRFEANRTLPPKGWSPLPSESLGAGLEPRHAARLLPCQAEGSLRMPITQTSANPAEAGPDARR